MNENHVTFVGRLTQDPELKFLNSGAAAMKCSLAVEKSWKNKDGEWEKKVSFFPLVGYGSLAEHVCESLHKGYRVVVTGVLEQRSWDTDEGKRSIVEVNVEAIGPDLRFVTCELHQAKKEDDDEAF